MYPREPLHVCENCDVPHYDNCPDCWGFGVRKSGTPISASVARKVGPGPADARACPTCQSTFAGAPDALREAGQ